MDDTIVQIKGACDKKKVELQWSRVLRTTFCNIRYTSDLIWSL